jgi:hypothetical protein
MSVLEDAFKEATKSLDFSKQRDRTRGFYVRRRAQTLLKLTPSLDALDLAVQLMAEQAHVMSYITQKHLALVKGPDPTNPQHLDLATMSKVTVASNANKQALESTYVTNRSDWLWQIVWRAVAIHGDLLWKRLTIPRELEVAALDEILDRRLRTVEQMHCNVNSGGLFVSTLNRAWVVAGPNGPWTDGILVRNFEYPFLPKKPFEPFLSKMGNWRDQGTTLLFLPAGDLENPQASTRFAKGLGKSWKVLVDPDTSESWPTFQPTGPLKHADVFRRMFSTPREDFFERNWLYCDQVGSSVNIEALEFGIQRRPGPHPTFEAAMIKPGYVRVGHVVRTHGEQNLGILMSDDADEFFENAFIDLEDLQVGDFVCFWNTQMYGLIAGGAWRNEYAHIMDVDADALTGKAKTALSGPQIWLSGHGVLKSLYGAMATELTAHIKGMLDDLRNRLKSALASNTPPPVTLAGQSLVQWSPYENFDAPGAWWIKIPKDVWRKKWTYTSVEETIKSVPRTVAKEVGGTGYHPPPEEDAVYFPLFEPAVAGADGDSWRAYLNKRKADPAFRPPSKLRDLTVDGRLAPGLYYHGSQIKIPVVRPKVRK